MRLISAEASSLLLGNKSLFNTEFVGRVTLLDKMLQQNKRFQLYTQKKKIKIIVIDIIIEEFIRARQCNTDRFQISLCIVNRKYFLVFMLSATLRAQRTAIFTDGVVH